MGEELAEIKALMQHQIQASESRHVENVRDRETLRGHISEMRATLSGVGSKVLELDQRMARTEKLADQASGVAHKALKEHDVLEGSLLREVGALASNDRDQNEALQAIKSETVGQSKTLDTLVKSESVRKTREDIIYWAITKGVPLLWAATLAVGGALYALSGHLK